MNRYGERQVNELPDNGPQVGDPLSGFRESRPADEVSIQDLYVCAGNRAHIIGAQNGDFPDFGHHQENEMGGLWSHPIKLLDGFWLHLTEEAEEAGGETQEIQLDAADEFCNYPYFNEFHYKLNALGMQVVRHQFCPDDLEGFVVTYRIADRRGEARRLTASFCVRTELSPVWFSEQAGIQDGPDEGFVDRSCGLFRGRDSVNPWFVVCGADRPLIDGVCGHDVFAGRMTAGQGIGAKLTYAVEVPAGGEACLRVFIAGSDRSEERAMRVNDILRREHAALLHAKRSRYEALHGKTRLRIPDERLSYVFDWVKFHTDWLTLETPGLGRGLSAGFPEYPWWFGCDNSYALLGLLPTGRQQLALETSELIRAASERTNGNGKIIHEITTAGAIVNPGNTQETPHYIQCVWELFLWTGDISFLRRAYPTVKKGLAWLLTEMDPDGDLLPEGYGIIEIEGLNVELIDSAVYTWSALQAGSQMAALFCEPELAAHYAQTAAALADKINGELWLEDEGLYGDAMAKVGQVAARMPLYIQRARGAGAEQGAVEMERMLERMKGMDPEAETAWLFKNWVINTPMETGLAPADKALRALERMATAEFTGPWGTYLSGMYQTQMMTISTGVQAVAEARYDRMDEALKLVRLIASTFNVRLPGSISEMSPDYGCFVQAWTNYGIVWPLMRFMFGIRPEAYWRRLHLRPRLPSEWRDAAVERVEIGMHNLENELNFSIALTQEADVYRFSLLQGGWTVTLDLPNAADAVLLVDGKPAQPDAIRPDGSATLTIEGAERHEVRVVRREPNA